MKKRNLLLALLAMLFSTIAFAQNGVVWFSSEFQQNGVYPGFVLQLNGDTTKGFIEYQNRTDMQTKCVFYKDANDKKTKLVIKPETVKGYQVANKEYRAIHYSGGLMAGPVRFLLIEKEGRISQYTWFDQAEAYSTMRKGADESQGAFEDRLYPSKLIMQKLDEKPFEYNSVALSYAKKMSELTADYPELSQKIANKVEGYGMMRMFETIDEYNKYWANKK